MRNRKAYLMVVLLLGITLGACDTQTSPGPAPALRPSNTPVPTATYTPIPTDTPEPSATFTLTPTDTPEPTSTFTPTPKPALELGEIQEVLAGGFSFRPVKGHDVSVERSFVGLVDPTGTIMISIYGVTDYSGDQSHEELVDEFLNELEGRGVAEFEKGEGYPITVSSVEGSVFDLSGSMLDEPIIGQAVLVMPSENQFLYGLAIADLSEDENNWEEGSLLFETLLETIQFMEGQEGGESACTISTDETYGYSQGNPVKVGGDWLEGPARERAYLDSLSGPNGEVVSYERRGSMDHGSTILDIYQVTYTGSDPVTLYLDEYNYAELMAPLGFICWRPIPLSAP